MSSDVLRRALSAVSGGADVEQGTPSRRSSASAGPEMPGPRRRRGNAAAMLPLVSRITEALMVWASLENDVIACSARLSSTVKSSFVSPLAKEPSGFVTVTKTGRGPPTNGDLRLLAGIEVERDDSRT